MTMNPSTTDHVRDMKSPVLPDYVQAALDLHRSFVDSIMQLQSNQCRIWAAWQKSLAAVNQELWDLWLCRFGGGVPLDG